MATVSITSPTDNSTVSNNFPACGMYDITASLDDSGGSNTVVSVVTRGTATLDTKTFTIPTGETNGPWSVNHTVPQSKSPLTGCEVTAKLCVEGVEVAIAVATNITISG